MIGLGLGLGMQHGGSGGGSGNPAPNHPLAGMFDMLLLAHRGETEAFVGVVIVTDGISPDGGPFGYYFRISAYHFVNSDNATFTRDVDGKWRLNFGGYTWLTSVQAGLENPADATYTDTSGGLFTDPPHVSANSGTRIKTLGMYTDEACTIRATEEGDLVAAWRDEVTGSGQAIYQPNQFQRFALVYVDGVPALAGSGTGECFEPWTPPAGTTLLTAHLLSTTVPGYHNVYDNPQSGQMMWIDNLGRLEVNGALGVGNNMYSPAPINDGVPRAIVVQNGPVNAFLWIDGAPTASGVNFPGLAPLEQFARGGAATFNGIAWAVGYSTTFVADNTSAALIATTLEDLLTP